MNFNIQPYNDDFEENAKNNNYLRILFKPGFSVQARELTQIQSILQNQIKSFGDHIFADGSPVIGGNISLDNKVTYLKLDETYNNEDVELDQFVGNIILRDSDSLVQAKVLASYYPSGGTPTLMVKYISGLEFADGDVFKVAGTTTRAKLIDSSASGKGTVASINDGIFYVDGYFVTVAPQTAVVAAYGQNANVKIGLEVTDEIVDSAIDSTLLDPAQDSFNYQAPGADRYQFGLTLSTRPLDTAVDESKFFELMRLENGAITKQVKYPIYSEIEKTLARRTYDESGDYTVIPFRASASEAANANNYVINIEPGKAYVKGFEFETIGTFRFEVEKPRTPGIDTRSLVDIDFDTSYGNYLKFKNLWGSNSTALINTDNLDTVDLHCTHAANVAADIGSISSNNFTYQNTKIGTARVRSISRYSAATDGSANNDSNGVFDVHFTDISLAPRVFIVPTTASNANSIVFPTHASTAANSYQNTTITVLPISLTAVANVNTANVWINSTRVNANSSVANVFNYPNVAVGSIIRVGDETRSVVRVNTTGDYLIVNSAFTKSIQGTNKDSNPLAVLIQNTYSSNVTSQTRKIVRYDGATKTAFLDRNFDDGAIITQNHVVQLDFAISDLKSFIKANATAITAGSGEGANAHANIAIQSLLLDGSTEMFEPSKKRLIFPLPQSTVKRASLVNVDYVHKKYMQVTGAAGVFTLSFETWESVPWSITNANIEENLLVIVRESSTAAYANGQVLKLSTGEVTSSLGQIIITLPSTISKIDAYINVKENNTEDRKRTKTYRSNTSLSVAPFNYPSNTGVNITHTVTVPNVGTVAQINVASGLIFVIDPSVTNIFPGDSISLYVPDVVNVRAIIAGNTTNLPDQYNYRDVTDNFVVSFGQTDEMYDHAKITLKQGYPSPNAKMLVHVDFYEHTYPAGASFFSVDSYESTIYESGKIPVYYSPQNGVFYLRDCLDFRPTRRIGLSDGTLDTGIIPEPNSSTELSFEYYLPRIDKLILSKNKEFRVVKGIASPSPIPPDDSDDGMTLYTLYLPPFVSSSRDIRLVYQDNRRYTMRDIASMDKRLEKIEYYTSLNNIESMAMNDGSTYEDGTDKAKFGVIGEGFKNFNIADYKDPDFSVNMKTGEMGPYVLNRAFGLNLLTTTNVSDNEKTLTLAYTETPMVSQPVTSNKLVSVQPFLFAQFIGSMVLSPEMDFWVSEELKPEIIRGPEVTQIRTETTVREIFNTERIIETIIERQPIVTVQQPIINATYVTINNPGDDPPATPPDAVVPVQPPAPPPVVPTPPIEPVIVPVEPPPVYNVPEVVVPVVEPPPPPPPLPPPVTPLPVYDDGGGGGCVVLESYIPWVEGQEFNHSPVIQAFRLQPEFDILLADEVTLATRVGKVKQVAVELQPCVRVTTIDGVSLVCSTTAPLPTLDGIVKAPDVLGHKVAVLRDGLVGWSEVISVESVGNKFVQVIDAHNTSFWAGEKEGAYILHHNIAINFGKVRKV